MDTVVQLVLNAIHAASLYSLVALGLTLILGVLDIADFAQGALYMVGAYVAYFATSQLGISFFLALPLAMVVGSLFAMTNYLAVYRPLRRFSGATTFIAALGLLLILQNLALLVFGADFRLVRSPFPGVRFNLLGATWTGYQVFLASAVAVLLLGAWLFLTLTPVGTRLRAASQNRQGALVVRLAPLR